MNNKFVIILSMCVIANMQATPGQTIQQLEGIESHTLCAHRSYSSSKEKRNRELDALERRIKLCNDSTHHNQSPQISAWSGLLQTIKSMLEQMETDKQFIKMMLSLFR